MLARLDAAHARLHQERRELELARQALRSIRNEPMADIQPADSMSVGELALALGVRPSALRHWEEEKLLSPRRNGTGLAATVRLMSATLASSTSYVRRATGSAPLRDLLPTLRREHDWDELLADRDHSIQTRARALLGGTAALAALLGDSRGTSQS